MRTKPSKKPYEEYASHAIDNQFEIVSSHKCGCFFCRSIYDARKVGDWISDERGVSALCPECGMDSVIGDASGVPLDKPLLKEMNLAYFGMDFMEKNPEAVRAYVMRYMDGKITRKQHNEELFVKYLSMLTDAGDPAATLALAKFYELGGDYIPEDKERACRLYKLPAIKNNEKALCMLGSLYLQGYGADSNQEEKAFECFAKASALGSLEAVYLLSDCYMGGFYVESDPYFAFKVLEEGFQEVSYEALHHKEHWELFPQFAIRLAHCYKLGLGVNKDEVYALRYYLLASLGENVHSALSGIEPNEELMKDCKQECERIRKLFNLQSGEPVYDGDTFYDSFYDFLNEDSSIKKVKVVSHNQEERTAILEMEYPFPPIIMDLGNVYAGFAGLTTRWALNDLSSIKTTSSIEFQRIEFIGEDSWRFTKDDKDGNPVTVLEINFAAKEPLKLKAVQVDSPRRKGK